MTFEQSTILVIEVLGQIINRAFLQKRLNLIVQSNATSDALKLAVSVRFHDQPRRTFIDHEDQPPVSPCLDVSQLPTAHLDNPVSQYTLLNQTILELMQNGHIDSVTTSQHSSIGLNPIQSNNQFQSPTLGTLDAFSCTQINNLSHCGQLQRLNVPEEDTEPYLVLLRLSDQQNSERTEQQKLTLLQRLAKNVADRPLVAQPHTYGFNGTKIAFVGTNQSDLKVSSSLKKDTKPKKMQQGKRNCSQPYKIPEGVCLADLNKVPDCSPKISRPLVIPSQKDYFSWGYRRADEKRKISDEELERLIEAPVRSSPHLNEAIVEFIKKSGDHNRTIQPRLLKEDQFRPTIHKRRLSERSQLQMKPTPKILPYISPQRAHHRSKSQFISGHSVQLSLKQANSSKDSIELSKVSSATIEINPESHSISKAEQVKLYFGSYAGKYRHRQLKALGKLNARAQRL